MNLTPKTKAILALIYIKYWIRIEENKANNGSGEINSEFQNSISLNENISSNTETNATTQQILELVAYKESIFEKIFKTIKNIFKGNNSKEIKNY